MENLRTLIELAGFAAEGAVANLTSYPPARGICEDYGQLIVKVLFSVLVIWYA